MTQAETHIVYQNDNELLVALFGEIKLETLESFRPRLVELLDRECETIYIDLQGVTRLDSAGLGMLVGINMTARNRKKHLRLLSPVKDVRDLFHLSKINIIIKILEGSLAAEIRDALCSEDYIVED